MACEIAAERVSQCVLQIIPDENAERCVRHERCNRYR